MRRRLRVVTLGCSKNTVDTEHLLAQLPSDSFEIVGDGEPADDLLLNTCGFIGDAKEESVQAILEAVELKKRGEAGRVAVFGCLSQRYSAELPAEIPEVDAWFGARDLGEVLRYLGVRPGPMVTRYPTGCRSYAYLKVSEGCDRRCSYCAIPYIRGAHRSVPMEDVMREAEQLVAGGARELILIAQDTTYYGLDIYRRRMLAPLLHELSTIDGLERLRIHYSYPDDFPEDVIAEMAGNPKVCRYLDIPLQHISDKLQTAPLLRSKPFRSTAEIRLKSPQSGCAAYISQKLVMWPDYCMIAGSAAWPISHILKKSWPEGRCSGAL